MLLRKSISHHQKVGNCFLSNHRFFSTPSKQITKSTEHTGNDERDDKDTDFLSIPLPKHKLLAFQGRVHEYKKHIEEWMNGIPTTPTLFRERMMEKDPQNFSLKVPKPPRTNNWDKILSIVANLSQISDGELHQQLILYDRLIEKPHRESQDSPQAKKGYLTTVPPKLTKFNIKRRKSATFFLKPLGDLTENNTFNSEHIIANKVLVKNFVTRGIREGKDAEVLLKNLSFSIVDQPSKFDEIVYNAIIRTLSTMGKAAEAIRWVNLYENHFILETLPHLSITVYNCVFDCLLKHKKYSEIIALTQVPSFQQLLPTITTYNILIDTYAHLTPSTSPLNNKHITTILKDLVSLDIQENATTYKILIKHINEPSEIDKLLEKLPTRFKYGTVLNEIVTKLMQFKLTEKAFHLLSLNKYSSSDNYHWFLKCCLKYKQVDMGIRAWKKMISVYIVPSRTAFEALLKLLINHNNTKLQNISKSIKQSFIEFTEAGLLQPSRDTYHLLIILSSKMKEVEDLLFYWKQMTQTLKPNYYSFFTVIRCLANFRKHELVVEILSSMRPDYSIKPSPYTYLYALSSFTPTTLVHPSSLPVLSECIQVLPYQTAILLTKMSQRTIEEEEGSPLISPNELDQLSSSLENINLHSLKEKIQKHISIPPQDDTIQSIFQSTTTTRRDTTYIQHQLASLFDWLKHNVSLLK